MSARFLQLRYAIVVAVSLALFIGGVVSGAAGSPFLLGADNVAGTATTSLTTASTDDPALSIVQTGPGIGIQATTGAGPAGYFVSGNDDGLTGVAREKDAYGLSVLNTSKAAGTGAAVRASSDANVAIFATSQQRSPVYIAGPSDLPPMVVTSTARVAKLNADATDGWSFGCPTSTVLSQGLCFGIVPAAAASAWDAADTCQSLDAGGYRYRLPSVQQLRAARNVEGIEIDANGEHADGIQLSGDAIQTIVVFDDGRVAAADAEDEHAFRCITEPVTFDLSLVPSDEQGRYPAAAPTGE